MRHVRRISWIVGAVFAALLFFIGGAFLRLLMGPISLGPLAGAIEDSINRAVTGFVVRFNSAVLEWSRTDGKIYLTVLGTKVFDGGGRIVAQAPAANLDFNSTDLLAGNLSLQRFALVGVQLTGVRTADGTMKLGFAQDDDSDLLKTIREILQSGGGNSSLDSLSIRNARLAFRDEPTGLFIVSPDTNFALESKSGALNATVDSVIEISGIASRVTARAKLRENGMPENGSIGVQGLSVPALAKYNPTLSYLQPYNITSNLEADFQLGENGELRATSFHVDGTGSITGPLFKVPLRFDSFDVEGNYDAAGERFVLSSVALEGKPLAAKAKASFTVSRTDGTFSGVLAELTAQDVRVALLKSFREELAFSEVSLKGDYDSHAEADCLRARGHQGKCDCRRFERRGQAGRRCRAGAHPQRNPRAADRARHAVLLADRHRSGRRSLDQVASGGRAGRAGADRSELRAPARSIKTFCPKVRSFSRFRSTASRSGTWVR